MNLLTSVLASFLGTVLFVVIAALFSQKAKTIATAAVSALLGVDIERVFRRKQDKDFDDDLRSALADATEVCILAGRGAELNFDVFSPLFKGQQPEGRRVRVLLPRTEAPAGEYDWVAHREREIRAFDRAFEKDLLRHQIETNARFVRDAGTAELRRFNAPHVGRIVITDSCAYFTPYRADAHGVRSPVYKYRRGAMYDNLKRLFEQLWDAGRPADEKSPAEAELR